MPDREPELNFDIFLSNLLTLDYSQCSPVEQAWRRSMAIAMKRLTDGKKGIEDSSIMKILRVSRSTFYYWLARKEKNPGRGASGFKRGRAPTELLSEEQHKELWSLVENKTPVECGIDSAVWSRGAVATLISNKFGVEVSLRWVGRMAKKRGFV